MESVMPDKIVEILESNNIIKDAQFGIRNKCSSKINLLDFFHGVYNMYDIPGQ